MRVGVLTFVWIGLSAFGPSPGFAVDPQEQLADTALEHRAREISAGLRCLVCQNESIDDSNASLARDLRVIVRQRLQSGDTDTQVVDYLVARYGEFVLLRPRFSAGTALLWLTPVLLLAGGAGVAWRVFSLQNGAAQAAAQALTPEEEHELRAMIEAEKP